MDKVLIFTATYNESDNITDFLDKVFSLQENLDILIVDDNSPDRTGNLIENYKKSATKNLHLIKRLKKEGLNTAHKLAFEYAKKKKL